MSAVLDASALLVYLEGKEACEKVKKAFAIAAEKGSKLLMSTVNWGEVLYILIRRLGLEKAEQITALIETLPIELVSADQGTAGQAAQYKAIQKLPYADSFAAALAKLHGAELLTSDREFHLVEKDIRIAWL